LLSLPVRSRECRAFVPVVCSCWVGEEDEKSSLSHSQTAKTVVQEPEAAEMTSIDSIAKQE